MRNHYYISEVSLNRTYSIKRLNTELDEECRLKYSSCFLNQNMSKLNMQINRGACNNKSKDDNFNQSCVTAVSNSLKSPELFLRYLDKYFKPEINLCDETKEESSLEDSFKENKQNELDEIKLNYKGHKHMNDKGKNAERRDVAYKTFIRSVRRYFWEVFTKQFDTVYLQGEDCPKIFKHFVTQFYNDHFKSHSTSHMLLSDHDEENLIFILRILISDKYSYFTKSEALKKPTQLMKSLMKSFNSGDYKKFFLIPGVSELFKLMIRAGFVDRIINAYPKLASSKDSYLKIANNIAEFKVVRKLLPSNLHKC